MTRLAAALGFVLVLALTGGQAAAQGASRLETLIRGAGAVATARPALDLDTPASTRYAIVIGNSDYAAAPDLPNATSDATVVAAFLRAQGYDVRHHENLTKRGFEDMLRAAMFDLGQDTEVVLFYAGHGFQIGSENYLVPTDSDFDTAYDVPFETVSLGSVVNILGARARLQVVILDACRDNPFAGQFGLTQVGNEMRETRTGFASLAAPLNSILVYSTSPGAVAYDGAGENSPFTEALINAVSEFPDAPVKDVFEAVRRAVYRATDGRQVPWDSSTLIEPVSFGTGARTALLTDGRDRASDVTRGLAMAAEAADFPDTGGDDAAGPVAAALTAPFQTEIVIGPGLAEALGLGSDAALTVTRAPAAGMAYLAEPDGTLKNAVGLSVPAARRGDLILGPRSVQIPARDLAGPEVADRMLVEAGGTEATVGVVFEADPCDWQAGDHLDPEGSGLTRYANEIEPEAALAACQAAVQRDPENGRFHYQLGRALRALRRTDEARAAFERARELGHTRAWVALGNALHSAAQETGGKVREEASDEVLALFAQGTALGDPYAFYALGRQFMRYSDDEASQIEGYDLMMRALEVGHTFAMNELGWFYLDEDNEFHDPERGLRYLRESAAREDIYGYNNMGLVYARGLGGEKTDYDLALDYFTRAAKGGHPNAPANIAALYRDGRVGGGPDPARAVEWYDESLARGVASAGGAAAYLIATEKPQGYALHDAAVRLAKTAALRNEEMAERAMSFLRDLPDDAVDAGAQVLIGTLGVDLAVDGAFGPSSAAALDEVLARHGAGPAASDRHERIVQLARVYWTTQPFRVDLY